MKEIYAYGMPPTYKRREVGPMLKNKKFSFSNSVFLTRSGDLKPKRYSTGKSRKHEEKVPFETYLATHSTRL
jgi:hypothetical protein